MQEKTNIEQSICLSCGICCVGVIFSKVHVYPEDDLSPLKKAGIKVLEEDSKKFFKQKCAAHRENCCGIYKDRPTVCRNYRCRLLRRFERGEISSTDVKKKIADARKYIEALKNEVAKTLPEHQNLSITDLLNIAPNHSEMLADRQLVQKWAKVLMNLSVLTDCIQKEFSLRSKNKNI